LSASGRDVNISGAVVASGASSNVTLTASNNINVNNSLTANGAQAGIALSPNTNNGVPASGTGALTLGSGGTINLPKRSPTSTTALVMSGTPYTVLNSLGAAGSTTGTDLQGMNGNLSGHYALGRNIDAAATATWNNGTGFVPIGNNTTSFTGAFNGLG